MFEVRGLMFDVKQVWQRQQLDVGRSALSIRRGTSGVCFFFVETWYRVVPNSMTWAPANAFHLV